MIDLNELDSNAAADPMLTIKSQKNLKFKDQRNQNECFSHVTEIQGTLKLNTGRQKVKIIP